MPKRPGFKGQLIKGELYCILVRTAFRDAKPQKERGRYVGRSALKPGAQRSFWHDFELGTPDAPRIVKCTTHMVVSTWAEYEQSDEYIAARRNTVLVEYWEIVRREVRDVAEYAWSAMGGGNHWNKIDIPNIAGGNRTRYTPERLLEESTIRIPLPRALEAIQALGYPVPEVNLPPFPFTDNDG